VKIIDRIRLAISAPTLEAELVVAKKRLAVQSSTLAGVRKQRDNARNFAEAAKREGLIPPGAWQRYVNCMTDSESESDIRRDIDAAESLRAELNRRDSAIAVAPAARTAAKEKP
jgi:hypothetical protein